MEEMKEWLTVLDDVVQRGDLQKASDLVAALRAACAPPFALFILQPNEAKLIESLRSVRREFQSAVARE